MVKHVGESANVAAVLAVRERLDTAALTGDVATLGALVSGQVVVNDPSNRIRRRGDLLALFQQGLVGYSSVSSAVEFAEEIGDLVVVMGTVETVLKAAPPGAPWGPGTKLHRRFTDVFRREEGSWRLLVRQSTVFSAD